MNQSQLKFLEKLVNINSFSKNPKGVEQVALTIKQQLSGLPLEWRNYKSAYPHFGKLYTARSRTEKNKPLIVLSGHMDTVYKNHSIFKFIGKKGDKFYGPGSSDMKGNLVLIVELLKKLHKAGKLTNIMLVLTPEEEFADINNFPDFAKIIQSSDFVLVYEADSFNAAREEKPDLSKKRIVTKRKGYVGATLKAKAQGGHSGVLTKAEERHSAIHELIFQAKKILKAANYKKGTTTNIGLFNGGLAANAIAQQAEISFDGRVTNMDEFKRLLEIYQHLPQNKQDKTVDLVLESINKLNPLEATPMTKLIFKAAQITGKRLNIDVEEEFRGGGSDANRFYYFNPQAGIADGFGCSGAMEHTKDEHLYLDTFIHNLEFSYQLLLRLADYPLPVKLSK